MVVVLLDTENPHENGCLKKLYITSVGNTNSIHFWTMNKLSYILWHSGSSPIGHWESPWEWLSKEIVHHFKGEDTNFFYFHSKRVLKNFPVGDESSLKMIKRLIYIIKIKESPWEWLSKEIVLHFKGEDKDFFYFHSKRVLKHFPVGDESSLKMIKRLIYFIKIKIKFKRNLNNSICWSKKKQNSIALGA